MPGCSSVAGVLALPCRRASVRSVDIASPVPNGISSRARPQRVAAEQREEPGRAGGQERVVAVAHQQAGQVGEALVDQPRQPGVRRVDGGPGAPRRRPPGPNSGVPVAAEREPHRERLPRRHPRGPGDPAPVGDPVGCGLEADPRATVLGSPGQPVVGALGGDGRGVVPLPHMFRTVEQWQAVGDVDAHMRTPHVAKAIAAGQTMFAAPPEIVTYARVDAQ